MPSTKNSCDFAVQAARALRATQHTGQFCPLLFRVVPFSGPPACTPCEYDCVHNVIHVVPGEGKGAQNLGGQRQGKGNTGAEFSDVTFEQENMHRCGGSRCRRVGILQRTSLTLDSPLTQFQLPERPGRAEWQAPSASWYSTGAVQLQTNSSQERNGAQATTEDMRS